MRNDGDRLFDMIEMCDLLIRQTRISTDDQAATAASTRRRHEVEEHRLLSVAADDHPSILPNRRVPADRPLLDPFWTGEVSSSRPPSAATLPTLGATCRRLYP